jgi:hypothetical protein
MGDLPIGSPTPELNLLADISGCSRITLRERKWTMQRIGDALDVGFSTIQRDLANLPTGGKSKLPKTDSNPKGSGRPKGSGKKRSTPVLDRARDIVRPLIETGRPTHSRKLENEHGISHVHFETAIAAERARKETLERPPVDKTELSMTAQQKLALAIRQATHKFEIEFDQRVRDALIVTLGQNQRSRSIARWPMAH